MLGRTVSPEYLPAAGVTPPCSLFNLGYLLSYLFVGRPLFVIHLNEFPLHDAPWIDHEGGGMGPAGTVRVEDAVAIDDFMVFVFQKREVELPFETNAHHLCEFFGVFTAVDADRQDLDFFFLLFRQ
jgi:hypothetical protein